MVNSNLIKKVSFTIPVFNNYGSLIKTYEQIKSIFENELSNFEYEVNFVNDGSKDNSLEELLILKNQYTNVKVIDFSRNFGAISAITAGNREALGDVVIVVSADLQDPLVMVIQMINEWEKGSEIVICYRESRNDKFMNKITSRFYFKMVEYHVQEKIPKGGFDYFLLDRKALNALNKINDKVRGLHFDILSLGFNKKYIPYERLKREIGKSQWTFRKRFRDFFNAFISISFLPIRIITIFGLIFSFSGFVYSILIVRAWFFNDVPFEGWAPIMVLLLIIGGFLMLMLGIIGEYIWRIYEETKKRENYIIKQKYD